MKLYEGNFLLMNHLNAKVLLKELLDFKNEVESIDQYISSPTEANSTTEHLLKDLVFRLKRYQIIDIRTK